MRNTTPTIKMFKLLMALTAFVVLTGAKGACFYAGPDTVVYERIEPHQPVIVDSTEAVYVEETITTTPTGATVVVTETTTTTTMPTYYGDLVVSYDFGGFTCGDMDIWTFDIALYDYAGFPVLQDFDLPCDIFSEIQIRDLEMGTYSLTMVGRDIFGYETLVADITFDHEDWITPLFIDL